MSKSTYSPILPYIYDFYKSKKGKDIAVLDYGCGDGTILDYFSKMKLSAYDGVEVNKNSVIYGNKKYKNDSRINFYHISTTMFPKEVAKKKYDLLIFLGVAPYMSNKEIMHFFAMAKSVMNKDGIMVGYSRTDHFIYSLTDMYQILLPHTSISSSLLTKIANTNGFKPLFKKEMGLFLAPIFNNTLVLVFDVLDKIIFRTKGTLGPFGKKSRAIMAPLIDLEQSIPINYGFKFYFVFQKR